MAEIFDSGRATAAVGWKPVGEEHGESERCMAGIMMALALAQIGGSEGSEVIRSATEGDAETRNALQDQFIGRVRVLIQSVQHHRDAADDRIRLISRQS